MKYEESNMRRIGFFYESTRDDSLADMVSRITKTAEKLKLATIVNPGSNQEAYSALEALSSRVTDIIAPAPQLVTDKVKAEEPEVVEPSRKNMAFL